MVQRFWMLLKDKRLVVNWVSNERGYEGDNGRYFPFIKDNGPVSILILSLQEVVLYVLKREDILVI